MRSARYVAASSIGPSVLLALSISCELVAPLEPLNTESVGSAGAAYGGGAGSGAGGAGDGHGGSDDCGTCPGDRPTCRAGECVVRGPTLIPVPLDGKSGYFIDSTEVTSAQYAEFLTAKAGDTNGQPPACGWNDSYAPLGGGVETSHPVTYVDWCDAHAYCAWADKQLCGRIGGGTLTGTQEWLNPTLNQWYRACGGANSLQYPYGPEFVLGACNENVGGAEMLAPVQSFEGCQGSLPNLWDMTGNAVEWTNICNADTGATDECVITGGSYAIDSLCETFGDVARDSKSPALGFRCCKE